MKRGNGYTILELLIFVAVSALIFIAALAAVGGRQQQVQFAQATREFDAKIRDTINDVTTGYYPSNDSFTCTINGVGELVLSPGAGKAIGQNKDCIYVGKAIQFEAGSEVKIYTVAGKRNKPSGVFGGFEPVASISDARPKVVNIPAPADSTVETYTLLYGLEVTKVFRPAGPTYGIVAIMNNFGASGVSDSQSVLIGGVAGSSLGGAINPFDSPANLSSVGAPEGLVICLKSPEGKKSSLTFGVKGNSGTLLDIDTYNVGCN